MKKLIFITFLLVIHTSLISQVVSSCLPDGITFMGQGAIDNFQNNYPGCTEIEGSVNIHGNIYNLDGLSVLTSIGGDLWIQNTGDLIDLSGLENLISIGGVLHIGNDRPIYSNHALRNFDGLENLTSVGGDVRILCNRSLTSLTGLESLNSIGGLLRIIGNDSLPSLEGLEGLNSIGGTLSIFGNGQLTSLSGIENINAASIGKISIAGNSTLSVCNLQNICDYLSSPYGSVNIYNNASGCNNPAEIANNCGFPLPCLPYGNYYVHSQADADSFYSNYQGCYHLDGMLRISGDDIINLNGLTGINSVQYLSIIRNPLLTSLAGLTGIDSIGGSLYIYANDSLVNLSGLDSITIVLGDLQIGDDWYFNWINQNLTSLTGLEGLTSIGGSLKVLYNSSLSSLSGLTNTCSIGKHLEIENNSTLIDLAGLDKITAIGGGISIRENDSLISLAGLDNIDPESITSLNITGNDYLSTCHVNSICNYLISPGGSVEISDNHVGCYSPEEVMDSCGIVGINFISEKDNFNAYPNPFTTTTTLTYTLDKPSKVTIQIYNSQGHQVEEITQEQPKGKQQVHWNAEGLPAGMYYFRIQAGDKVGGGEDGIDEVNSLQNIAVKHPRSLA